MLQNDLVGHEDHFCTTHFSLCTCSLNGFFLLPLEKLFKTGPGGGSTEVLFPACIP